MRAFVLLVGVLWVALATAQAPGYYRHPAIHGDTVVFTAEGDLWAVAVTGGAARRLTTHAGEESRAVISPDGAQVAFTASYAGAQEAYVMPLGGGAPQRVSFEELPALVIGWTPAGEVLYGTQVAGGTGGSQRVIVAVDPATLARRVLPLAEANDAAISADGRTLYFVRFGAGLMNDNLKGYRGGLLGQLWRFDLSGTAEAQRIGPADVNLRRPMLHGNGLIVIADPQGRDTLARLDSATGALQPLALDAPFDVRSAAISGDRIVYSSGADLRLYDLAAGRDAAIPVRLVSDFAQRQPRWLEKPLGFAEASAVSPDGERLAVIARGQVAVAGVGAPRRALLGADEGTRLSALAFSPDRRFVYAISDASGEEEIWRYPADGGSTAKQLTRDGDTQRWDIHVSPDGKWLAHSDKRGRLWLLDVEKGVNRLIDDGGADGNEGYEDIVWTPDSRHLAFVRASGVEGRSRIGLYSLDRKAMAWLTGVNYESGSPAFSPDGQWLWFLSEREFRLVNGSPWGDRNTGPYFDRRTRIYALALQPGNRFPFQARDELHVEKVPDSDADAGKGKGDAPDAVKALVWNGLAERLFEVPVAAGNYASLAADAKRLYFLEHEGDKQHLRSLAFDADKAKLETFASDVKGYALSGNGKVLAVQKDEDSAYLLPAAAKAPDDLSAHKVRLDDWRLRVDPVAEWRQMFNDAWRMHRDHFYDAKLRGVDWQAVRARYAVLLPRVTDRLELDDLFGQMIGELNALHSQVRGGEYRKVSEVPNFAGLGARFAKTDGGWRIEQIYRTDPELPSRRGPLQKPGSDIRAGDVVTAVNGRPTLDVAHVSDLVRNNAGQQVLLTLSRGEKTWQEVVVPADAMGEDALRYSDWLISRREAVDAASGGRIGYLHLRAMGPNDIAGFVRDFYAQVERDGLIVDVRRNRGGNIDSWVFEKLLRRVWAFWQRPGGLPYGNMQQSFRGHIAVLADAMTYSDGETFAAGTRALGIGPLIGTRTAGAGVWLTDSNALVDKGRARVAEIPQYDLDGQWIVEGTGVAPDIEVDNLPHESFNGSDRQLDAAIQWLTRKLEADPVKPLRRGAIAPLAVR